MAMTASSVTTVDGRSRICSPVGTPVMGHEPNCTSATGTPTSRTASAARAPSAASRRRALPGPAGDAAEDA